MRMLCELFVRRISSAFKIRGNAIKYVCVFSFAIKILGQFDWPNRGE